MMWPGRHHEHLPVETSWLHVSRHDTGAGAARLSEGGDNIHSDA